MIMTSREECIAEMAYYLWLDAGMPDGLCFEFWLQAEKNYEAMNQ